MRSISISRGLRCLSAALLAWVAFPGTARAHVAFDSPLAGDTLVVGETVSITWTDLVLHDPESFDLDLLLSEDGEAIPIAHGLSIDTHSYEWTVPDQPCTGCLLRVIQFNTFNYDYWESIEITITSSGASGGSGGTTGAAGEESGGTSGASDGALGGVSGGGTGGTSSSGARGGTSNEGGANSTGGSDATGGSSGSSPSTGGTSSAGAPPAAGAGTSGDGDEGSADEGCSASPSAPASRGLLLAFVAAACAFARARSRRIVARA